MDFLTKRTKKHIQWEIDWNNYDGMHTFSMCKCGRRWHRGETRACNLYLKEELREKIKLKK